MGILNFAVLWGSFLTAFFIAIAVTPVAIWIAPKIGAMDVPKDKRKIHNKPIPRIGGVAIFLGTMASVVIFVLPDVGFDQIRLGVVLCGSLIFLLGLVDDLKEMSPGIKFAGQIVTACTAYVLGIRVEFIGSFMGLEKVVFGDVMSFVLTVLWIVGIMNAVNLIDGLDGLAAGIAAIASLCIAYVPYIHGQYLLTAAMLTIAGGALGFLPYNFHPAKIFMGDSGSQFLGFCLATFALIGPDPLKGATFVAVLMPALVLGLPIFDTIFAIIRRLGKGKSVAVADKEHLHHRIMRVGFGQRRSVMLMYCISGIMGVVAVTYDRGYFVECIGLLTIVIMLLVVLLSEGSMKKIRANAIDARKAEQREKREKRKKHADKGKKQ